MTGIEIDVIKDRHSILSALIESKKSGTLIGIKAEALGPDIFVTCVQDIIFEEDRTIIVLKNYDMTGTMLRTNILNAELIDGVYAFQSKFENPIVKTFLKFFGIKKE